MSGANGAIVFLTGPVGPRQGGGQSACTPPCRRGKTRSKETLAPRARFCEGAARRRARSCNRQARGGLGARTPSPGVTTMMVASSPVEMTMTVYVNEGRGRERGLFLGLFLALAGRFRNSSMENNVEEVFGLMGDLQCRPFLGLLVFFAGPACTPSLPSLGSFPRPLPRRSPFLFGLFLFLLLFFAGPTPRRRCPAAPSESPSESPSRSAGVPRRSPRAVSEHARGGGMCQRSDGQSSERCSHLRRERACR